MINNGHDKNIASSSVNPSNDLSAVTSTSTNLASITPRRQHVTGVQTPDPTSPPDTPCPDVSRLQRDKLKLKDQPTSLAADEQAAVQVASPRRMPDLESGMQGASSHDTDMHLDDVQENEEWADVENESKRVKVYELIGSRWVDQGTAFCFGQFQEETSEAFLVARSEIDYNHVILTTTIRTSDVYQQQAETLIVWTEPDGVDYALSFQDPEGCSEVWNFIQEVQQHLRNTDAEISLATSSPVLGAIEAEEPSITASAVIRSGHLPQPALGIIPEIERAIRALARTIAVKERICEYIQREEYIKSMVEVFHTAEDLESLDNLHALCSLMQTILMLNDHSMYEHILEYELFFGVIGMLEYDPEFPTYKANYREFLHQNARFHHPITIRDPLIQRKVHYTYRLQFIKDVVLARALDDSTFNVLNSCIIFNQIDIITHVQSDPMFLRDVVKLFVHEDMLRPVGPGQESAGEPNGVTNGRSPDAGSRADAYAFAPPDDLSDSELAHRRSVIQLIQHLCVMGKNVQLATRLALFRTLVDRGILFAVQWALGLPEREDASREMISVAGEILSALLDHDLIGVRGHVLKQNAAIDAERAAGKRGADKAESILALICRMMATSRDLAIQSQVGDALKAILDFPPDDGTGIPVANGVKLLARGGKDELGTEKFLEYMYHHCTQILFKPFGDVPEYKDVTAPIYALSREKTNLYTYLCDLLCNCTLQHTHRSVFFVLSSNIPLRVATLLRARDKYLRLAAFRLYRIILKRNDKNMFHQLMKYDLFQPILELTVHESRRDNLLSASCHEFFDHIRKENFKDLIKHCMTTKHEKVIRQLAETPLGGPRFTAFIRRWEMNNEPLPPEDVKTEKPADGRIWPGQGRLMEAEEEDYFNADDEDDDNDVPSISAPRLGLGPILPSVLKRKRRVAISGASRNFRPLNLSAALRTPSPSPILAPPNLATLVDYEDEDDVNVPPVAVSLPPSPRMAQQPPPPDDDASSSSSPLPLSPSLSSGPFAMAPMRPSEKRRRGDDEEDGLFERLSKSKKVEMGPSKPLDGGPALALAPGIGLGLGRGVPTKLADGIAPAPPRKLKMKFALGPLQASSSGSPEAPARSKTSAKDGDTG